MLDILLPFPKWLTLYYPAFLLGMGLSPQGDSPAKHN